MDLNASPVPEEEDEDIYEEKIHVQEYTAPDDHIESGAAIARRVLFLVFLYFIWFHHNWPYVGRGSSFLVFNYDLWAWDFHILKSGCGIMNYSFLEL